MNSIFCYLIQYNTIEKDRMLSNNNNNCIIKSALYLPKFGVISTFSCAPVPIN